MHDFLDYVEGLQKEKDRLQKELNTTIPDGWYKDKLDRLRKEHSDLTKQTLGLKEQVETLTKENKQLHIELTCAEGRLKSLDNTPQEPQPDCRWFSVKEEEPEEGERVVVITASGNTLMSTYDSRCGFMTEAVAWLKLPEYIN